MMRPLAVLMASIVAGSLWGCQRSGPIPPGAALRSPDQQGMLAPVSLPAPPGYSIIGTDQYSLEALVVSVKPYSQGREADLSPVDFALVWGPLLQEPYRNKIRYSQDRRWYFYRWTDLDTDASFVGRHSANTHIVIAPDHEDLRPLLLSIRPGDVVRLGGYLIQVRAPDGWQWNSSRTRQDTGNGACELFYVTAASRVN